MFFFSYEEMTAHINIVKTEKFLFIQNPWRSFDSRFKAACIHVSEVLNVHLNENNKKYTFLRRIFFSSSEKLTFEQGNVIFFNTFLKF